MSTVFVVRENGRMDYTDAERFGQVEFMTADEFSPIRTSIRNRRTLEDIDRCLERFDPERDWLVLTGSPVLIGHVFHQAMQRSATGQLQLLQWDRANNRYRELYFPS